MPWPFSATSIKRHIGFLTRCHCSKTGSPSELLISDEGIQRVDEILTRIEHNIFS
jgi:hypothetical protein